MSNESKVLLVKNGWNITCDDTLSDAEQREDARIGNAVVAKVNQMKTHGIPVARYNAETGEVFLEDLNNKISANT